MYYNGQGVPKDVRERILNHGGSRKGSITDGGFLLYPVEAAGDFINGHDYYVGRETVIPSKHVPGMAKWREQIYAFIKRNAERSAAYFSIPATQVIEIGIEIDISPESAARRALDGYISFDARTGKLMCAVRWDAPGRRRQEQRSRQFRS